MLELDRSSSERKYQMPKRKRNMKTKKQNGESFRNINISKQAHAGVFGSSS